MTETRIGYSSRWSTRLHINIKQKRL